MDTKRNLKYVVRKGSDLDLDDLSRDDGKVKIGEIIKFFDKLLFKHPVRSFGFLIMFVALPISLYLTLKIGDSDIGIQAAGSKLVISESQVTNISPNKTYEFKLEIDGVNINSIDFIEVKSPDWFTSEGEIGNFDNDTLYKLINYSGKIGVDVGEKFTLLIRGTKSTPISICKGCDKEDQYLYGLSEFNLSSEQCDNKSVWGRNPLGDASVNNGKSNCERFDNKCLMPASWKSYSTLEECLEANHAPEFIKLPKDEVFTFTVNCDGEVEPDSFKLDEVVEAKDVDGDIVRFSVDSQEEFLSIEQDGIEDIVKNVTLNGEKSYVNYIYTANYEGNFPKEFMGKTSSVKVSACDTLNECSAKTVEISAVRRSSCDFILPLTGDISVNISSPVTNGEFKGIDNIVWEMSGTSEYFVEVNLYQSDCSTFIYHIARFPKIQLDGSKGYAASWDSRAFSDGEYCVKVLAREDEIGSNWDASDQVVFNVRNDNQNPHITSTPPDTNLVTGETFDYTVTATDPDGDQINYDVIGNPSWISFSDRRLTGSSAVPGSYNFAVFVDDNHQGYDIQNITINVRPPRNQPSVLRFVFPVNNSVLSGSGNNIEWEAQDNEGISSIRLYYSSDGKSWILIGTYPSGTSQADWDVSALENGEYFLRLVVIDSSSGQVESSLISESFYIANKDEGEVEGEDTSMPAINNLTPEPDSEIKSDKPLISASLHASNNGEIDLDSIEVLLDDESIVRECTKEVDSVICESEESLELGRHKVNINVTDTNDKSANEEWYFTIIKEEEVVEVEEEAVEDEETIVIPILNVEIRKSALTVSVILCCAALVLIIIPWLVYFLWSRSGREISKPSPESPVNTESSTYQEMYPTTAAPKQVQENVPTSPESYQPASQPQEQAQPPVPHQNTDPSIPHGY